MSDAKYGIVAISDEKITLSSIEDYKKVFNAVAEYAATEMYDELIVYRLSDGIILFRWNDYERGDE